MSKATVHLAYVAAGLTCQGMVDLLKGLGNDASEAEQTRLQSIVGPLSNMAFSDGMKFLKDTVQSTKATEEGKPDATVKSRASEVRQIYAALKLVQGFNVTGMGYWKALDAAKQALKDKGIRATGAPVLSDEQKAAKALEKACEPIKGELIANPANAELTVAEVSRMAQQQAAERLGSEGVRKHAERILKANGVEYACKLVDALTQVIGEHDAGAQKQAEAAEAAEAEKQQKAA